MAKYYYRLFEDGMGPSVEQWLVNLMVKVPDGPDMYEQEDAIQEAQELLQLSEYPEDFLAMLSGAIEQAATRPVYQRQLQAIAVFMQESKMED